MTKITVKGHEFDTISVKDSHSRKAQLFKNKIIQTLGKIGLTADDVEIDLEPVAIKKTPASCAWYFDGHHLYYSYAKEKKYVDNLFVVLKVIELLVDDLLNGTIAKEQFIKEFAEDEDIKEKRKKARELIGVSHDTIDMDIINKKFKDLAKEHHPDKEGGDVDKFKALNHADKVLKKELE